MLRVYSWSTSAVWIIILVSLCTLTLPFTGGYYNEITLVKNIEGWQSKGALLLVGFIPKLLYILARCIALNHYWVTHCYIHVNLRVNAFVCYVFFVRVGLFLGLLYNNVLMYDFFVHLVKYLKSGLINH